MTKFSNKYNAGTSRLDGWDYSSEALYFITICTKNRMNYFGEITSSDTDLFELKPTEIGEVAYDYWLRIPQFHSFISLDAFVIMPDHVHAVIGIINENKHDWNSNKFGPQRQNLAAAIRGYKASVTKYALENAIEFAWQPKYYDRIVRNDKELFNIREYIDRNPESWMNKGNINESIISKIFTGEH